MPPRLRVERTSNRTVAGSQWVRKTLEMRRFSMGHFAPLHAARTAHSFSLGWLGRGGRARDSAVAPWQSPAQIVARCPSRLCPRAPSTACRAPPALPPPRLAGPSPHRSARGPPTGVASERRFEPAGAAIEARDQPFDRIGRRPDLTNRTIEAKARTIEAKARTCLKIQACAAHLQVFPLPAPRLAG